MRLHNGELGKISKVQRSGQWPVWENSLHNPSCAAFAEQCGAKGVRVDAIADLDAGIEEALGHEGPALVEVSCDANRVSVQIVGPYSNSLPTMASPTAFVVHVARGIRR